MNILHAIQRLMGREPAAQSNEARETAHAMVRDRLQEQAARLRALDVQVAAQVGTGRKRRQ